MEQLELIDIKKKSIPKQIHSHTNPRHLKGIYSELLVITRLVKQGYTIALPYGSQPGWDILVEVNGKFEKWQIKTGSIKKPNPITRNYLPQRRVGTSKRSHGKETCYQSGEFDYLIAVFPDTQQMFKIPIQDILHKTTIRVQSDNYKW